MSVKNSPKISVLGMFVFILISLMFLQAEGVTGIKGRVTDTEGSFIPGVLVKIVEQSTGKEYATSTDIKGFYFFKGIIPGIYDLYSGITGFIPYEKKIGTQYLFTNFME